MFNFSWLCVSFFFLVFEGSSLTAPCTRKTQVLPFVFPSTLLRNPMKLFGGLKDLIPEKLTLFQLCMSLCQELHWSISHSFYEIVHLKNKYSNYKYTYINTFEKKLEGEIYKFFLFFFYNSWASWMNICWRFILTISNKCTCKVI